MLLCTKAQQATKGHNKLDRVGKDEVPGSNPGNSSKSLEDIGSQGFFFVFRKNS